MLSLVLPVLGFASVTFALPMGPALTRRAESWCAGLGPGGFDTAQNFTLAAVNTTLANTNAVGVPLVLGQAGAVDGAEFEVLSTYASYPYNDFPSLSLISGALIPNSATGATSADANVTSGGVVTFVTTSLDLPTPAQIYCAVADIDPEEGSPYPILSVNGDTDGFALCLNSDGPLAQNNIVWQPTEDNGDEYLYDTCYPVNVQLLGLNG